MHSCRLPDSASRGVVFQLRISPRIRSQNRNGSKCSVRDLCRTDLCKNPRKSASLPCPFNLWSLLILINVFISYLSLVPETKHCLRYEALKYRCFIEVTQGLPRVWCFFDLWKFNKVLTGVAYLLDFLAKATLRTFFPHHRSIMTLPWIQVLFYIYSTFLWGVKVSRSNGLWKVWKMPEVW
jgi:hypothetical protein